MEVRQEGKTRFQSKWDGNRDKGQYNKLKTLIYTN